MQFYCEEPEITDFHMFQKVVGMFENKPNMQRIITCGLMGKEYDSDLDVEDIWTQGNHRKIHNPPLQLYTSFHDAPLPPAFKAELIEREKARNLREAEKGKEKAEKKRLKKQKQKLRRKMEKEKENPGKPVEEKGAALESNSDNDQKKKALTSNGKLLDVAQYTESSSSEQESSDEDDDTGAEELDLNSSFVSKAADIAKRQLEQKPKAEKKKSPEKEKPKSVPDGASEALQAQKTGPAAAASSSTYKDNVKISTELAIIGNRFASTGDYDMAVKYFTDAIKYNPKEFKLFGNRSFCFEKMQEYEKALMDAELSLGICPGWIKGLFRKGRALAGLKRYEEAAEAFRGVLKLDSSYAEAAQELMRVQIIQLMAHGFTREQSSNALIIHGTVNKALEVLSKLHGQPDVLNGNPPPTQVANINGVSPILSANSSPAPAASVQSPAAPSKPLTPVQNIASVQNKFHQPRSRSVETSRGRQTPPELFPVWVGNLNHPVTDSVIIKLFSKVGPVHSVKVLTLKRCAFINFTKQEHCDEAIREFHGYDLNGFKIAVRYPDRIPPGMNISKSAQRYLQDERFRQADGRMTGESQRPLRTYKPVPDQRGSY